MAKTKKVAPKKKAVLTRKSYTGFAALDLSTKGVLDEIKDSLWGLELSKTPKKAVKNAVEAYFYDEPTEHFLKTYRITIDVERVDG